jgi:hypothetical protein
MIINERGFSHIFVNEYVAEAVGRCGEFVNRWLKRNGNISNDPGNRSFWRERFLLVKVKFKVFAFKQDIKYS